MPAALPGVTAMSSDTLVNYSMVLINVTGGKWEVTVREADGSEHMRDFATEEFALSYAYGQRIRLRLVDVKICSAGKQIGKT